jgi:hypothetical protein
MQEISREAVVAVNGTVAEAQPGRGTGAVQMDCPEMKKKQRDSVGVNDIEAQPVGQGQCNGNVQRKKRQVISREAVEVENGKAFAEPQPGELCKWAFQRKKGR